MIKKWANKYIFISNKNKKNNWLLGSLKSRKHNRYLSILFQQKKKMKNFCEKWIQKKKKQEMLIHNGLFRFFFCFNYIIFYLLHSLLISSKLKWTSVLHIRLSRIIQEFHMLTAPSSH